MQDVEVNQSESSISRHPGGSLEYTLPIFYVGTQKLHPAVVQRG